MRRYFLLSVIGLILNFTLLANPGDTTWVQANNVELSWYNNYDTAVVFPTAGKTYRKILMIFTLGKYMCPAGSSYCGDWDYTVLNYLMTPTGDTFEMGRLITPYANAGAPRTGWSWQQHYVFDVSDYASKLIGPATMRILYSGYSGGFTANIKFAFIEGTPERTVLDVKRLWNGSFNYGDTTHLDSFNINTHFQTKSETAPVGTQTTALKFLVTGHGSDTNNCNEFCSHNYQVLLNSTQIANNTIWRSNCGANELYPQSGTWLFQRANWCPGAMVYPQYTTLPSIVGGNAYNIALTFDPYTKVGNGSPIYTTEAALVYYGGINKMLDASIEDIINPNKDENHYRENPFDGNPTIHIRNTGSSTITSIAFQYYIDTASVSYINYFTWTGSLAPLTDTEIELPEPSRLRAISGDTFSHYFNVKIDSVNGTLDADTTNNMLGSYFYSAPNWPAKFRVYMQTNNEPIATGSNICETSWIIYDINNSIVASRQNANMNTLYDDTLTLGPGTYKLQVYDSSCDGLHWWVWDVNPGVGINAGYICVKKLNNNYIKLNTNVTNNLSTQYHDDFGCGFTQYFTTNWTTEVTEISATDANLVAFPNPAKNIINIELSGIQHINGNIHLIDALGRVVLKTYCNTNHQQLFVENLNTGLYTLEFINNESSQNKLTTRLLIVK